MRVLHVTEALGGGVQSAIANYVDCLSEIEHSMFSRARDGQATHVWAEGMVAHESYEGSLAGFFARLVAKVRAEHPDVVHLHSSFAGAARAVLPPGSRVVYSPHCYAMERRDIAAPIRWSFGAVEFLLARRRQLTIAVSPREADISARLNRRNPARLVLNPSPFDPVPRPAGTQPQREIVMVGRISPQKDPALFAAVARALGGGSLRFVWIGDGDDPARAALEGADVEITGWMPPTELRERLSAAALYLHTAAWEGGPVSTIEAAALGVPVLARGIPSMRSLGYALAGETPDELAASVRRFFAEPTFSASVAETTAALVAGASKPTMTAALRDAYTSAAERNWGRPSAR